MNRTTRPKSLLDVAGWGTGSTTLNDELRYDAYQQIHFMVIQGMHDRETLVAIVSLGGTNIIGRIDRSWRLAGPRLQTFTTGCC